MLLKMLLVNKPRQIAETGSVTAVSLILPRELYVTSVIHPSSLTIPQYPAAIPPITKVMPQPLHLVAKLQTHMVPAHCSYLDIYISQKNQALSNVRSSNGPLFHIFNLSKIFVERKFVE